MPNESTMERAGLFLLMLAGSNLFLLKIVDALVYPAIVHSRAANELPIISMHAYCTD